MKSQLLSFITLAGACTILSCTTTAPQTTVERDYILAMHCFVHSDESGQQLLADIPDLAARGINTLILETGYHYEWSSHPELREHEVLSRSMARKIASACKENGIMIVPLINCVGHQSWERYNFPLLAAYPEFDETPGAYPDNNGIYCRSWCTSNEAVYEIIFDLIDEIASVFETSSIHIGMDEIFLIGEDSCEKCRGRDKGDLLAHAINKFHAHCVKERKMTLYLWGDRLLDGNGTEGALYDEWESSRNGTSTAINKIPKDIIICDWHYNTCREYASIPYLMEKGFSVLPASFKDMNATRALTEYSLRYRTDPKLLGHLYTAWGETPNNALSRWKPMQKTIHFFQ